MASFFRQFNAIGPLFCSFVQHHQLELRTSKTYSKRQNLVQNKNIDVQNLENIGSLLRCFSVGFFWHYATFFEVFWISPKGLPFVCVDILQHNGCQKSQRGPPFTFFGTVTLFKNLILKFFIGNFLKSLKGPPLIFSYFATYWSFRKPKGSPLLQFWAVDIAPT